MLRIQLAVVWLLVVTTLLVASTAGAAGKFAAPVQNTFSITFDSASATAPGPQEFRVAGSTQNFDNSYAGESASWGSFGGAPDSIIADIVENSGPAGTGDHAARLTVNDATPGSHFSRLIWQVKGLQLGNSGGGTASGGEPVPSFDTGLAITVAAKTNVPNARFRVNFDTGSQTRTGRYDDPMGGAPLSFVQGNVPGLIDNLAPGSRILPFGTSTTGGVAEIGVLPVATWTTNATIGGVPVLQSENPSSLNGWGNISSEPFFSRAPRSFDLTRVGVTFPGGGVAGDIMVAEWTMSGPDVLKYHAADFNYDQMVDAADIDMLFDAIAFLALNNTLPSVPDSNLNGALDRLPVAGVDKLPHVEVTLPEKFSLTTNDNSLDFGDVDELVLNILGTQYGDLDLDGVKNATDRTTLVANLNTSGGWAMGDLNGDSLVNAADLAIFDGPATPGDFSGDRKVDAADLTLLLNNWGGAVPPAPSGWTGQAPTAPAVDADELTALLNNWGVGTAAAAGAAVPEPTSIVLAIGAAAFCLRRRS